MLYFDARLSAQYPTVEVRVADVCLLARDTVLVAGTGAARWSRPPPATGGPGRPPDDVPTALLRLAAWRAGRSGLDENLLDPGTGRPRRASEVVAALVEHVRPALDGSGDLDAGAGRCRRPAAPRAGGRPPARGAGRGVAATLADVVADAVDRTARRSA